MWGKSIAKNYHADGLVEINFFYQCLSVQSASSACHYSFCHFCIDTTVMLQGKSHII
jgi:hypothetical protein